MKKAALLFTLGCLTAAAAFAATEVCIPHVTVAGGWTTVVKLYNPGYTTAQYTAQRYNAAGDPVGVELSGTLPERSWGSIGGSALAYEGFLRVTSAWNLLVKVEYRYADTPSVCEFFLDGATSTGWVLPNSSRSWMNYTGLAVVNTSASPATLTVQGWKNGAKVAPDFSRSLGPGEKFVALTDQLWTGVGYDDLDTLVVRCSTYLPAPVSITGNFAGDRHLFFAGQVEPHKGKPTDASPPPTASLGDPRAPAMINAWCSHVTAAGGWKTTVSLFNASGATGNYTYTTYDAQGNETGSFLMGSIPAMSWAEIPHTTLNYEGSLQVTGSDNVVVKSTYQFGDSPSVCEFYVSPNTAGNWVIPNSVRSWMNYTGLAFVNPTASTVQVSVEAWKNGRMVALPSRHNLAAHAKFVRLSEQLWTGIGYDDADTLVVRTSASIPAPISITGNSAGDRHLFFAAQAEPVNGQAADPVGPDPIVGALRFIPRGLFVQGSPAGEPCREDNENQFVHLLNTNLAAMETEVTRQMWADLRAVQPGLPADPSAVWLMQTLNYPVQQLKWHAAVLFANLLSLQNGLQRCYYKDWLMLIPVDASNYAEGTIYWRTDANGYRLPTEGEWEYMCRAGTSTPFWIAEPAYAASNCEDPLMEGYDQLETAGWFSANSSDRTHLCGYKAANPWGLFDVHGNVQEFCWDAHGAYPSGSQVDYRGPAFNTFHITRGGNWDQSARAMRSAQRSSLADYGSSNRIGFRLVRTLP
ncbi:MAG: formylglycine-generating enzyme family protein [Acidobacteria bacterium]|nr:formylglycine-generating enzyme family protein [Acidobacteriota bacterium]